MRSRGSLVALVLASCTSFAPELQAPDTGPIVVVEPDAGRCLGVLSPATGPCLCNSDCESALCATEQDTGLPGGSCVQLCDPLEPAPAGYTCPMDALFKSCSAGEPCREGYICFLEKATRRTMCLPQCSRDSQCPTSGHCDLYSGHCRAELDAGAGLMGSCTRHEDCKSSHCTRPGVSTPPWCATLCNTEDRVCPEGGSCLPTQFQEPDSTEGLCLKRCFNGVDDCPPGFTCNSFSNCIPGP